MPRTPLVSVPTVVFYTPMVSLFLLWFSIHPRSLCSYCGFLYTHGLFVPTVVFYTPTVSLFLLWFSIHPRSLCSYCGFLYTHGLSVPTVVFYTPTVSLFLLLLSIPSGLCDCVPIPSAVLNTLLDSRFLLLVLF